MTAMLFMPFGSHYVVLFSTTTMIAKALQPIERTFLQIHVYVQNRGCLTLL
jgi:hypothetical protein